LGLGGAAALASREPEMMRAGAALRAAGARVVEVVGGRTVHPVSLRVGGFGRLPRPSELEPLRPALAKGLEEAARTVRWVSQLPFPPHRGQWELVALAHPEDYPVEEGRPAADTGRRLSADGFLRSFAKEQLPHSTALHLRPASGGVHLVGPLARYSLNHDRLPPKAAELAREAGLEAPCRNPFRSILVRAVEMALACEECLRLLEDYAGPEPQPRMPESFSGSGEALTEAPRGVLHHRYQVSEGRITEAEITTPTAHNQAAVEADLQDVARRNQGMPEDQLRRLCDQTVRNYDPCLSCSTH
jgi:coenzyme F420-reducing hydrogenase alpha subunit